MTVLNRPLRYIQSYSIFFSIIIDAMRQYEIYNTKNLAFFYVNSVQNSADGFLLTYNRNYQNR